MYTKGGVPVSRKSGSKLYTLNSTLTRTIQIQMLQMFSEKSVLRTRAHVCTQEIFLGIICHIRHLSLTKV